MGKKIDLGCGTRIIDITHDCKTHFPFVANDLRSWHGIIH